MRLWIVLTAIALTATSCRYIARNGITKDPKDDKTNIGKVPGTGGNDGTSPIGGPGGIDASEGAYSVTPRCTGGTTCRLSLTTCGVIDDGCGGNFDCGKCPTDLVCDAITHTCGICLPKSCVTEQKNCGTISDGCGGTLDCGVCAGAETCGGTGTANKCGCRAKSCRELGKACGVIDDGCGQALDCDGQTGGCAPGQECSPSNTCFFPSCEGFQNCEQIRVLLGKDKLCGPYPDGCGGIVECEQCEIGEVCDRETNVCKKHPRTNPLDPNSPPANGGLCPSGTCPGGFLCVNGKCRSEACGDRACGGFIDACGVAQDCDAGSMNICGVTNQCIGNQCQSCNPIVCQPRMCGLVPDTCGSFVNCPNLCDTPNGERCHPDLNRCVDPVVRTCDQECAAQGKNCGTVRFWNGSSYQACDCAPSGCPGQRETCGGAGFPGICGLTAPDRECVRQAVTCGDVTDTCGNTFNCSFCGAGNTCDIAPSGGRACRACTAADYKTCADYPGQCGSELDDNCGGKINCSGACPSGVCDNNPGGVTLDVCCAAGEEIAALEDPGLVCGEDEDMNNAFTACMTTPVVGDCCLPLASSKTCPSGAAIGAVPSGYEARFCGTREDSCNVDYTCSCPSGVCDTNAAGGNVGLCCGPAGRTGVTVMIAQADDANVPDFDDTGIVGGVRGPGITGLVPAPTGATNGNCCQQDVRTRVCPPGYCGLFEDNCGAPVDCTNNCAPNACDNVPGGTNNVSMCCAPGQVVGTGDEAGVADGQPGHGPPGSVGTPGGVGPSGPSGECCSREVLQDTCWVAPPNDTSSAFCDVRENNCGENVNCRSLNSGSGCPGTRLCDDRAPGTGLCCATGEILGDAADGAVLDGVNANASANACCTQQPVNTTCRVGVGGQRQFCTTTVAGNVRPREDNCNRDVSCPTCPVGSVCSDGPDGVVDSPFIATYNTNGTGAAIVPIGECCLDMTDDQACGRADGDPMNDLQCGTVETVCGRNVICGTCGTDAFGTIQCDLQNPVPRNVCCADGNDVIYAGQCCNPAPFATTCSGRCGVVYNNCGQPVNCGNCTNGGQCDTNGGGVNVNVCCDPGHPVDPTTGDCCVDVADNPACDPNSCSSVPRNCGQSTLVCSCASGLCDTNATGGNLNQCCAANSVIAAVNNGFDGPAVRGTEGNCCVIDPASTTCPMGYCGTREDNCNRNFSCGCGLNACDSDGPGGGGAAVCCANGQVIATAGATNASAGDCCTRNVCPSGSFSTPDGTQPRCRVPFNDGCGAAGGSCGCPGVRVCNMDTTDGSGNGYCCPSGMVNNPSGADCVCANGTVEFPSGTCCTPETQSQTCAKLPPICGATTNNCGQAVDCGTGFCEATGGSCDAGGCVCPTTQQLCQFKPYCNRQVNTNPCNGQTLNCNGCPGGGG